MTGQRLAADQHAALSVRSRRQLLDVLRAADGPQDVAALAEAVGLHVTTARFHLDVLTQAGLVARTLERDGRPGRPRRLYGLVEGAEATPSHRQLAEALVGVLALAADEGAASAEEAGRRWARRRVPAEPLSWDEGSRRLASLFEELGFAPRVVDDSSGRHLELDRCPFRDLARRYPGVVCTVHAGLLREALVQLEVSSAEDARLRPFVEPELCIADLPRPIK